MWQLQEVKVKLTQLVTDSKLEPQIISRHRINESIISRMIKNEELCDTKKTIVDFFEASPLYGLDIDFERDQSTLIELSSDLFIERTKY